MESDVSVRGPSLMKVLGLKRPIPLMFPFAVKSYNKLY